MTEHPSSPPSNTPHRALLDTGPLVALLDASEEAHDWAIATIRRLRAPLVTCEPVLAEAMHLLRRLPDAVPCLAQFGRRSAPVLTGLSVDQGPHAQPC